MGGYGSGRWYRHGAKSTSYEFLTLDIRQWQRRGVLAPGTAFCCYWVCGNTETASIAVYVESDEAILSYRRGKGDGKWVEEKQSVLLDRTLCNFRGKRTWFLCPGSGCGRRVALLYGGTTFLCRHCNRLAYPSQRECPHERATRRVNKIRGRLGWRPGILNPGGGKPKGMHWRTYERLIKEHYALANALLANIAQRFNIPI